FRRPLLALDLTFGRMEAGGRFLSRHGQWYCPSRSAFSGPLIKEMSPGIEVSSALWGNSWIRNYHSTQSSPLGVMRATRQPFSRRRPISASSKASARMARQSNLAALVIAT
ncbi:MAG: hypothetical protein KDA57_20665, partial [Planctomycetales bacterium]|nr:hypothetical protein [Planctomycetales bacterium]